MAIIGISGKIGSGKDTIAKIIQYLTGDFIFEEDKFNIDKSYEHYSSWKVKKFAGKLKQIVSLLTGISIEDLEKEEIKNKELGEEWIRYAYASGFTKDDKGNTTMLSTDCDKERYELELKTNWQTAYKVHYTPRLLLQRIGSECLRDIIHPNVHINALFSDYRINFEAKNINKWGKNLEDKWLITDLRFPNEAQSILDRDGILIRANRWREDHFEYNIKEHISETALDNYKGFHYTINNNGTIEELIEKVREILIKEKIIN